MSHFIAKSTTGISLNLIALINVEVLPQCPVHGYVYEIDYYSGADKVNYKLRFCFDDKYGWLFTYSIID